MNFLNELFMFLAMKGSDIGSGLHAETANIYGLIVAILLIFVF